MGDALDSGSGMDREGQRNIHSTTYNDEDAATSPPATAPSGWSSMLTWRYPTFARQQQPQQQPDLTPPTKEEEADNGSHLDSAIMGEPSTSTPHRHERTSSTLRARAPIPFDIGPRRELSSSPSRARRLRSPSEEQKGNATDGPSRAPIDVFDAPVGLNAASARSGTNSLAYGTLSRVKAKDRVASSASAQTHGKSPRNFSAQHEHALYDEEESQVPGGWIAWGTTRLRGTISRGMASTFFANPSPAALPQSDDYDAASPSRMQMSPNVREKAPSSGLSAEEIDAYVERTVSFAGVDFEDRAVVTLAAPCLPSVDILSLDVLLGRILARTSPLVETPAGYTLVLFASGAKRTIGDPGLRTAWPGWTWCWRAWRSLGRSYRKNLKKLVIVHPTLFTRTLVRFVSTGSYFVSPKVARKIVQCDSLEELERHVPLSQLDIPPEVLVWDLRGQQQENALADLVDEGDGIPALVQGCVDTISGNDSKSSLLHREGIFRVPPSSAWLSAAKYAYHLQPRPSLSRFVEKDRNVPAALLKAYLRSMDPPMFPKSTYPLIKACPTASLDAAIAYIQHSIIPALGSDKRRALYTCIVQCLRDVARESRINRMDAVNLSIVVTPNMIRTEDVAADVAMCAVPTATTHGDGDTSIGELLPHLPKQATLGVVVMLCIAYFDDIFRPGVTGARNMGGGAVLNTSTSSSYKNSSSSGGGGDEWATGMGQRRGTPHRRSSSVSTTASSSTVAPGMPMPTSPLRPAGRNSVDRAPAFGTLHAPASGS